MEENNIYALIRVSTDRQDFNSQMQGIYNYCKSNNINLLKENIIEEYAVSGFKTKLEDREGLQKIIDLALTNKINKLIVFNQDRIGRRMELLSFMSFMTESNVEIVSVTEGLLNDKDDDVADLIQCIKFWNSGYESKKTSARVQNGKLASAKNGLWQGGKINLGYKVVDNKLIVDPTVTPIIYKTYTMYIEQGTKATLEYLKKNGINKIGSTLAQMIKNPIYKGCYAYNPKFYTEEDYKLLNKYNKDLQIVEEEIWGNAQECLRNRTTSKSGSRCKTLNRSTCEYEGLLYHKCGNKLTIDYDYRNSNKQMMFKCKSCKIHKRNEYQKSYSAKKLLPILDKEIQKLFITLDKELLEKKYIDGINSQTKDLNLSKSRVEGQVDKLINDINLSNNKLKKMLIKDSSITTIEIVSATINEMTNELEELELDRQNITNKIDNIEKDNKIKIKNIEKFVEMKDIYVIANYKQKRQILQILIDRIEIEDYNNITIYTNI